MKKFLKILALLICMGSCFLLGWRVMPRIWPEIREYIVYPLIPSLRPDPAAVPEQEPYVPESNTKQGDPLSDSDSVIYYFYKEYCPYCSAIEPLTAGLPDTITLPDGTESAVRLICLNKNEESAAEIIAAYYEEHNIPEERRYVPAVVIGDRYLMPGSEIIDGLLPALVAGEGLRTPRIP